MPAKALAITSRHHPVAIACYAGVLVLSLLYLLDVATAASLTDETSGTIATVWQITLLVGSSVSLLSVLTPLKYLLPSLVLESLGTMVLGIELGVYSFVMWTALDSQPYASIAAFSAIAIGCLFRSFTALRDRRRIIRAASAMQITATLAEPE